MKRLVYAFGPDGAGKSTLVDGLSTALRGGQVIHASRPELWPDTSWHQEAISRGIDPTTTDPSYHLETLARCYSMAGNLLRTSTAPLIIDSDPRAQIAVKACTLYDHPVPLPEFYAQLDGIAQRHLGNEVEQMGIHVTIGRGTAQERAEALVQRLERRDTISAFDPNSVRQAHDLVVAFDGLESVLEARGQAFVRIETDQPFDLAAIPGQALLG